MGVFVTLGEKRMPMRFDTQSIVDIEDELGSFAEYNRRIDEKDRPYSAKLLLIAVCANGGYRHEGSKERIDSKWLIDNLSPDEIKTASRAATRAFVLGMRRMHAHDEDEDVDVVAEEIKKKVKMPTETT